MVAAVATSIAFKGFLMRPEPGALTWNFLSLAKVVNGKKDCPFCRPVPNQSLPRRSPISKFYSPESVKTVVETYAESQRHIFAYALQDWGPNGVRSPFGNQPAGEIAQQFADRYCRELARSHYENFSVATLLVPKKLRQDFANIYAFCRWSDDLADEVQDEGESLRLLEWWRHQLVDCFAGNAWHPVMVALRSTLSRHRLPSEPFHHLLDAFVTDQSKTRYASDAEVLSYCKGSANPVGRMILGLAGVSGDHTGALSDQICSGLQIANFCQDLPRDARLGRIYLPFDRMGRFGVSESDVLTWTNRASQQSALADWCRYAESLLLGGAALISMVPRWLARNLRLFVGGGLAILSSIQAAQFDVWSDRPSVSNRTKARIVLGALLARPPKRVLKTNSLQLVQEEIAGSLSHTRRQI